MAEYNSTDPLSEEASGSTPEEEQILQEIAADFSHPAPTAPPPPVPPVQTNVVQQPVYAMPPQPEPRRVRRVGSITAGLALIAGGVLLCIAMFRPSYQIILTALKFTPVFIILLGVEILLSRIGSEHVRLKYDFLAVVMVFFVLCAAGAAACVPIVAEHYSPELQGINTRLEKEAERRLHEQLKTNPTVDNVNVEIYLGYFSGEKSNRTLDQLSDNDSVHTNVTLQGDFADAAAFAKACESIVVGIKAAKIPQLEHVYFSTTEQNAEKLYSLDLSGAYRLDKTVADWTALVEEEFYIPGYGGYGTAEEKARYEEEQQLETAQVEQQQEEEQLNLQREREELENERIEAQAEIDRQQAEIDRQREELDNQAA